MTLKNAIEYKYIFHYTSITLPLSFKITQHRDNNNQNVSMHVIVTLICNLLFFNSNTMSNTLLYKMLDFHRKLFQNIQQATIACINIKTKYESSYFAGTIIGA